MLAWFGFGSTKRGAKLRKSWEAAQDQSATVRQIWLHWYKKQSAPVSKIGAGALAVSLAFKAKSF
jgi:hypothetical protein